MEVSKTLSKNMAFVLIGSLIVFAVAWRLAPHLPNFAPVSAIALMTSMIFGWKKSLLIVAIIMAISDLTLGFYPGIEWTWLSIGLISGIGPLTKKLSIGWGVSLGVFGASLVFFLVSNFGTWISSGMYSLDVTGLMQCYIMALPFFRATLLSDACFMIIPLIAYQTFRSYYVTQASHRLVYTN